MISSVLPLNSAPHSHHTARRRKCNCFHSELKRRRRNSMINGEERFCFLYPDPKFYVHIYTLGHTNEAQHEIYAFEHLVCTWTLRGRSATSGMKAQSYGGNGIHNYDSCVFCVAGFLCRSAVTSQRKTGKSRGQKKWSLCFKQTHQSNTLGTLRLWARSRREGEV